MYRERWPLAPTSIPLGVLLGLLHGAPTVLFLNAQKLVEQAHVGKVVQRIAVRTTALEIE